MHRIDRILLLHPPQAEYDMRLLDRRAYSLICKASGRLAVPVYGLQRE